MVLFVLSDLLYVLGRSSFTVLFRVLEWFGDYTVDHYRVSSSMAASCLSFSFLSSYPFGHNVSQLLVGRIPLTFLGMALPPYFWEGRSAQLVRRCSNSFLATQFRWLCLSFVAASGACCNREYQRDFEFGSPRPVTQVRSFSVACIRPSAAVVFASSATRS